MEEDHHVWDENAALRMLNNERERSENITFLNEILGPKKQVIVDLGCGPGFYAIRLKPFASMLYCVDSSKAMLSMASKRINGKTVTFLEESASNLSLPDSSVDIVFMANSFHDMEKDKASVEIARILKSGGKIIVVDWKKGTEDNGNGRHGPPENLRMSEAECLGWFPGFRIVKEFDAGKDHFGIVLMK